jgi:hypothetical protein
VIGDLISPFKAAIGLTTGLRASPLGVIHRRFGLPAELPKPVVVAIKAADSIAAYFEQPALPASVDEATRFFDRLPSNRSSRQRWQVCSRIRRTRFNWPLSNDFESLLPPQGCNNSD